MASDKRWRIESSDSVCLHLSLYPQFFMLQPPLDERRLNKPVQPLARVMRKKIDTYSNADIMTRSPSRNPSPRSSPSRLLDRRRPRLACLVDTVPDNNSPGCEFDLVVVEYFRTSPAVHCMNIDLISRIPGRFQWVDDSSTWRSHGDTMVRETTL